MKSEKLAIKKLTEIQSRVSAHYFIKQNGEIILMVPDLYAAWHAGDSQWKKYKLLNNNSIGIELTRTFPVPSLIDALAIAVFFLPLVLIVFTMLFSLLIFRI